MNAFFGASFEQCWRGRHGAEAAVTIYGPVSAGHVGRTLPRPNIDCPIFVDFGWRLEDRAWLAHFACGV